MNLNRMHDRIAFTNVHLQQPSFWCAEITPESLVLHCSSTPSALAPLVIGIVRGLATMHGTSVAIEHRRRLDEGAQHDEFLIRIVS